jgi:hypothetical protein
MPNCNLAEAGVARQLFGSAPGTDMSRYLLSSGSIRKKRWLRDARGEREHAHHARHAKHASHEKVPLGTPQRTLQRAHGVGTACAQSINADRRTARKAHA